MNYAINDFHSIANRLPSPANHDDRRLWYLASLVSELAYHHVPEFELEGDSARRAKAIPSDAFQEFIQRGQSRDVRTDLREVDLGATFVIEDRSVIVVGIQAGGRLFLGFRGTVMLFLSDWRINFRSSLKRLDPGMRRRHGPVHGVATGRYHQGFAEEAVRVGTLLNEQLERNAASAKEVILTGHSLGGAVAAICEPLLWDWPARCKTITFGAPRFCDAHALYWRPGLPLTIKRPGDMVPIVPPRFKGYADSPHEFDTLGRPGQSALRDHLTTSLMWRWTLFAAMRARAHFMENYRREVGQLSPTRYSHCALTAAAKFRWPRELPSTAAAETAALS